uniref:RNA-editing substrate-binding complex 6 protein domain-containing protein n=2 Tax=Babesia bovis TaxID=5865 RepID=A7ATS3_BABBO|eukprot:XP_001609902.1 hypothetical protein [Babesia bovis T2Bo]
MADHRNLLPFEQLVDICVKRMDEANSIDLATIAQTAVLLKRRLPVFKLMEEVANVTGTQRILDEISASNAVLILYAFAQTHVKHDQLFNKLSQVISKMSHDDFQMHLIPLALHALAQLRSKDRHVLENIADYALKVAEQMQPANISSTVCAMAKLRYKHPLLLRAMANRTKQLIPSINIREMSNILWGFGKLRYDDKEFVDSIIDRCSQYSDIDELSFAQTFEAIRCYHAVHKEDVIKSLTERYLVIMPQCSTQIVTQVAWCCTSLGFNHDSIISKSLEVLTTRNRNAVEQKFVKMLLDALNNTGLEPEDTVQHYIAKLTSTQETNAVNI